MRVVVAADKFKGSLPAAEVCRALAAGLRAQAPDVDVVSRPVADGGEGTLDAALAAGFERVPVTVSGPTGRPVQTAYARRGDLVLIELAAVCGSARLPDGLARPMSASSYGLGETIRAALDAGARRLIVGVGGSASTDGGAGLLQALGARVLGSDGRELRSSGRGLGGGDLARAHGLDLSGLDPRLRRTAVAVACDVDNPLLGARGAAAVYGPQKGAGAAEIATLEAGLRVWSRLVTAATGTDHSTTPGAGAAGDVGFAALAALGARVRPGIEVVLELVDLPAALAGAALVVTGEGSLDEQTLAGKAPLGVARAAARAGVPAVVVAGRASLRPEQLREAGFAGCYRLNDLEPDATRSITHAAELLRRVGAAIAREHLPAGGRSA